MNTQRKLLAIAAISSVVVLVIGLIAIPAMEKAQASLIGDRISLAKNLRSKILSGLRDRLGGGDHPGGGTDNTGGGPG